VVCEEGVTPMSGLSMWQIALAVWLLLWGILAVTNVRFDAQNLLMGVLAVATAVLILFRK
jgi:hypothetical protein